MKIDPRPPVDAGHGVTRTGCSPTARRLMLVEFAFAEGGEGLPHSHPHVQSTFVKAGRYRFTVGDESFEVGPGDAFVVPVGRRPTAASSSRGPACSSTPSPRAGTISC